MQPARSYQFTLCLSVLLGGALQPAFADPGDPVAIRHLPRGGFAIDTQAQIPSDKLLSLLVSWKARLI